MFMNIDKRLQIIKHKNYIYIYIWKFIYFDFHQVPPVHDSWVFQPIDDGLNSLAIYFWQNKIQCFELPRVM